MISIVELFMEYLTFDATIKFGDYVFCGRKPLQSGGREKRKISAGVVDCSVILKASHPFGPVARLHAASFGPGAANIEVAMPVERPQLFEPDLPDGPIQEGAVDRSAVPVQTNPPHFVAAGEVFRRAVIQRRLILGERPDVVPETIEEERYPVRRLVIDVPVVVLRVAA